MKSIYQAAHVTDAYMVRSLLEQARIEAWIRGEHLQGGLGELPLGGQITVCVAEADAGRARRIVTEWDRSLPDDDDDPEAGDGPDRDPRPDARRSRTTALVAAALLVPVLWWAMTRLLG